MFIFVCILESKCLSLHNISNEFKEWLCVLSCNKCTNSLLDYLNKLFMLRGANSSVQYNDASFTPL